MNSAFKHAPHGCIGELCRYVGVEIMTSNSREFTKEQASFLYSAGEQYFSFEYPKQVRVVCWNGVSYQLNQFELENALRFVLRFKIRPVTAIDVAQNITRSFDV